MAKWQPPKLKPNKEAFELGYTLGQKAFAEGKSQVPAQNKELLAIIKNRNAPMGVGGDGSYNYSPSLMDGYTKGWTNAHFSSTPSVHDIIKGQSKGPTKTTSNLNQFWQEVDSYLQQYHVAASTKAKFKGTCGKCYREIRVGDDIDFLSKDGKWVPVHSPPLIGCRDAGERRDKELKAEGLAKRSQIEDSRKLLEAFQLAYSKKFKSDWYSDYKKFLDVEDYKDYHTGKLVDGINLAPDEANTTKAFIAWLQSRLA